MEGRHVLGMSYGKPMEREAGDAGDLKVCVCVCVRACVCVCVCVRATLVASRRAAASPFQIIAFY